MADKCQSGDVNQPDTVSAVFTVLHAGLLDSRLGAMKLLSPGIRIIGARMIFLLLKV